MSRLTFGPILKLKFENFRILDRFSSLSAGLKLIQDRAAWRVNLIAIHGQISTFRSTTTKLATVLIQQV